MDGGELALLACLVCGATGKVGCHPCRGSGVVDLRAGAPGTPRARARAGGEDALSGRWLGQGALFQFSKAAGGYQVTEHGTTGPPGKGTAVRHGRIVTLDVTNDLLGRYVVQLRVEGNQLEGTMLVRGHEVPFILTRE